MEKIELLKSQQLVIINGVNAVRQAEAHYKQELGKLTITIAMIAKESKMSDSLDQWTLSSDGRYLIPVKEGANGRKRN